MSRKIAWDAKKQAYDIKRYHDRRKAGLCPRCPTKTQGTTYCDSCNEKRRGQRNDKEKGRPD